MKHLSGSIRIVRNLVHALGVSAIALIPAQAGEFHHTVVPADGIE
jgi:hypothetical protein